MSDIPSSEKWRNKANFEAAEIDAARAQEQGISIEQLTINDEAGRLAQMPDAVEPENQEAITESLESDMVTKLNDQHEAVAPVEHSESSQSSSHSLFSGESGDISEGEGETTDQATSTRLFSHSQELDSGGEEI